MKKLSIVAALLLVVCMLFVSCQNGAKPTVEEQKTQSVSTQQGTVEKTSENPVKKTPAQAIGDAVDQAFAQGYDLSLDLNMGQELAGVSTTTPLKWNILSNADGSVSLQTAQMEMLGISATQQVYVANGNCYISTESLGVKTKYYMPETHEEAVQGLDSTYINLGNVAKVLKDSTVKAELDALLNAAQMEKKDDATVYSFEVSSETLGTLAQKLEEARVAVAADKGTVKVTLSKDGALVAIELDVSAETDGIKSTVKGTVTVNNGGKAVNITAPEGLDSYVSYDEMMDLPIGGDEELTEYDLAYQAIFELYDENMQKVSDYDEQLNSLKALYGDDNVNQAAAQVESDIQELLDLMGDLG